ncbi:MAG: poly(R)-hydroxyalkanoic acid synthase subunit PhaE [Pseudomonadales bacterium]|jgi:hypothetical protein|nr:poly(R)-hydroxyalkanoic acid synthase subunit PhaE [Pseudomonadales bacterium]MDP6472768.1 poly(R)-hydroxyalkanoic acid synthase subunit PhaE [Pseudomonadales bacterium]MDP6827981.1 poly(R)-hydroxyalkanoic acid synthase subunit PhaE [Pseudomonadales bacterium]MDP6972880.1 poly(R)-hydroxyalkanoic acid synthase subunit PhaE [Pseudomonadales bacterium]|tara:strand:- start:308 stop:697 length:390 start_codon:yes stop_codon:yes gene_type:complete
MSEKRSKDPGEVFRELVTEWERGFDQLANSLMGTENFSRSMNQMQDVQMAVRGAFREFMTDNLTNANMPTRDDVVQIAQSLKSLEKRMERIETLLQGMTSNSDPEAIPPRGGPPRTKRPPSETGAEANP